MRSGDRVTTLVPGGLTGTLALTCTLASAATTVDPATVEAPPIAPREPLAARPGPAPSTLDRDEQLGPGRYPPAYARAALEMAGLLTLGVAQYWMNVRTNSRDWDFPHWSDRLNASGVRFDNNTHVTNNVLHPLGGSTYYAMSRANGLNVVESGLYTLGSSAVWEWGLEWREKISINDMVSTTLGGIAAGEFFVQLASYLNSSPTETSFGQDVAKGTLGFPVWVHDELDGRVPDPLAARDNLGFSSAYHHRFTLDLENAWASDTRERTDELRGVSLEARIASLPGYLEPEAFESRFARGNFVGGSLSLMFDGEALRETLLEFEAVLAGYYVQSASPAVLGALVGLATGIEFVDRDTLGRGDQYALVHCVGPQLGATWKWTEYQLDLRARASADFAAIRSLAWPSVHVMDPEATYKSTLDESYQYHFGVNTRVGGDFRFHAARLSAELGWGSYRSIQGLDRFQEDITRDLAGKEVLDEYRVALAIEPPHTLLRLHGEIEGFSHESSLGGQTGQRQERRFTIGAGIVF